MRAFFTSTLGKTVAACAAAWAFAAALAALLSSGFSVGTDGGGSGGASGVDSEFLSDFAAGAVEAGDLAAASAAFLFASSSMSSFIVSVESDFFGVSAAATANGAANSAGEARKGVMRGLVWKVVPASSRHDQMAGKDAGATSHFSTVDGTGAKFLLDAEELVVFRHAVGAAKRAGFDLAGVGGDGDVGDGDILGFARAVADDGGVVGLLGHLDGIERLGE